jgi:signal transduction histidine kinase
MVLIALTRIGLSHVLDFFLAITAVSATATVYSYFSTRAKLAQVQTTTKAILESLVGGVLTLDMEGRITIINRAASQILEVAATPPYPDLTTLSRTHKDLAGLIQEALETRRYVQDRDSIFVNSRNEQLTIRTSISEYVDEEGHRIGIVVLVKDVSKLIAMESELRKQDRLATAGSLAAGVAHEIRNPLSAIELNLRLLRDEVMGTRGTSEDIEGYFEILFAETRRLSRITSSFLELSRPLPIVQSAVPFHRPLLQVIRLLEREAQEKNISFVLDLVTRNPYVLGDATKLEQVCLNILINAMQAMPSGGIIRIASAIVGSLDGEFVHVSFADQGVGISPQHLPRLFDPYFTTRAGGTGLGLAIADRIVSSHRGKILVESAPGSGTIMTVCLPLADARETSIEQELHA